MTRFTMTRSVSRGDRGTVTLLMAVLISTALVAGSLMWWLSGASVRRARAQAVADLTALAAVADNGAEDVVLRANGATLVEIRRQGPSVRVVVRHGGFDAAATAEPVPGDDGYGT